MTVSQLIELLSEMDPGDKVRLATQPVYPLAFHIAGVAALDDEDDEDDGDEFEPGVVWIAAGDHPDNPYAPAAAFEQAQW